jgi:hypothetical protein
MIEDLQKAHHTATFTANDLREALSKASAVEALVLLPMIQQAYALAAAIDNLLKAKTQHG